MKASVPIKPLIIVNPFNYKKWRLCDLDSSETTITTTKPPSKVEFISCCRLGILREAQKAYNKHKL